MISEYGEHCCALNHPMVCQDCVDKIKKERDGLAYMIDVASRRYDLIPAPDSGGKAVARVHAIREIVDLVIKAREQAQSNPNDLNLKWLFELPMFEGDGKRFLELIAYLGGR